MTIDPLAVQVDGADAPAPRTGRRSRPDDVLPAPTAGMVLHRTLAMSARTFLLNDVDDGLARSGAVDALRVALGARPLWAQSAAKSFTGTERRADGVERIHQSRVAMRRIRSNLRTFRLLLDPRWGTALRAELAWYGGELGRSRDLDRLAAVVAERGGDALDAAEMARMTSVIAWRQQQVAVDLAADRAGPRRLHLTEQMMVLWEGPAFKAKATRPATEVLPAMLHRSWRDVRGAARTARKDPSDAHLHQLRIRLKDLRYGAETVALVEGGPARKVAKSAESLQSKLGDVHDAVFSIAWLGSLAGEQPDLADAAQRLISIQRDAADRSRKGWKRELKDLERRWRRWQG